MCTAEDIQLSFLAYEQSPTEENLQKHVSKFESLSEFSYEHQVFIATYALIWDKIYKEATATQVQSFLKSGVKHTHIPSSSMFDIWTMYLEFLRKRPTTSLQLQDTVLRLKLR